MQDWYEFASSIGFPAAFLLLLVWALIKAGRWAGDNVVKPLTNAAIEYLQVTAESMKQMSEAMRDVHHEVHEHNQAHRTILEKLNHLCEVMDQWGHSQKNK